MKSRLWTLVCAATVVTACDVPLVPSSGSLTTNTDPSLPAPQAPATTEQTTTTSSPQIVAPPLAPSAQPPTQRTGYAIALTGDPNVELPCAEGLRSQLAYSLDTSTFVVCNGTAWSPIDIRGPRGDAGPQGAPGALGPQGAQGAKGDSFTVVAPTLSDSTLTFSNIDIDSAKVTWQPAAVTASMKRFDVEYLVVLSESDNIDTLADVHAHGTWVAGWQTPTSATVTGLQMDKEYFVNVLARTSGGGTVAYTAGSFTTAKAVFMFSITGTSGNFTRSTIDGLCQTRATALSVTQANVRALISMSATDEIADMPANYGVPTGVKILSLSKSVLANNWTQFIGGTTALVTSLNTAGVVSSQPWTGSTAEGAYNASNCTNWTGSGAGMMAGFSGATWLANIGGSCGTSRPALCIAWD